MEPVRIGLMGLGAWARQAYLPVLKDCAKAQVVAVSARTEETLGFARQQFGDGIAGYGDLRELANDPTVEAVMIALPNRLHAAAARAALAAGKHVFIEPPVGFDEREIREVLGLAAAADVVFQTDLELRYTPVMGVVAEEATSGVLGESLMATMRLWCGWGYGGGDWQQAAEDQGFFLWLGCWYLDVLDRVFGAAPLRASVTGGRAMNGSLMDHGWATLEYPDDCLGQFEFSLVAPEEQEVSVRVTGTEGEIEADLWSGRYRRRRRGGDWARDAAPPSQPIHGFSGMRESILSFLDCVQSGSRPVADVEVSRRVHEAALACMGSEQRGETVACPFPGAPIVAG